MQPLPVYNSRALAGAWEHPAQDPPRDLPRDLLLDSVPTWACLLRQPPFGAKLLLASSNTLPRPAGTLRALASRRAAPARGITSILPAPPGFLVVRLVARPGCPSPTGSHHRRLLRTSQRQLVRDQIGQSPCPPLSCHRSRSLSVSSRPCQAPRRHQSNRSRRSRR